MVYYIEIIKMRRNAKRYLRKQHNRKSRHVSGKSDNRVWCPEIERAKFLYPTLKKAQLACKYSDNPQRPYYCKSCCGYHTTKEPKEDYYAYLKEQAGQLFGGKAVEMEDISEVDG